LAIASFVCGCLFGVASLLAVIFGHIARNQIRRSGEKGEALARRGLILGYVGLAVIAVVIPLHFLVFNQKPAAKPVSGFQALYLPQDLRSLATAEESYFTENDTYTSDGTALAAAGYHPDLGTSSTVTAEANGKNGYCLVGGISGYTSWYLYNSDAGGIQSTVFTSEADAEHACTNPATGFADVVGTPIPVTTSPEVLAGNIPEDDNGSLLVDVSSLMTAEHVYWVKYGHNTTNAAALRADSFGVVPDAPVAIYVSLGGRTNVCVVASLLGANPWWIYPGSGQGDAPLPTKAQAERACPYPHMGPYVSVVGTAGLVRQVTAAQGSDVAQDLASAARAEEQYMANDHVYIASGPSLVSKGYIPVAGDTLVIGVNQYVGYCLIDSRGGTAPWYLYDSEHGGLIPITFATETVAEGACNVSGITRFWPAFE
jgi:hypothetical protein